MESTLSGVTAHSFLNISPSAMSVCVCMHRCKHLFFIVPNSQEHTHKNRRKGRVHLGQQIDLTERLQGFKGVAHT